MSSKSTPSWIEVIEGQSFVQVLKPSPRNENVIIGARQFVKVVAVTDSGLSTLRSVKSSSAGITAAAFHPLADSVMIAAGSNGEVSVLYFGTQNIAALNEKWTAHSRAIHGAEFLPVPSIKHKQPILPGHFDRDSGMLLTVSADGEMNCWDVCAYSGKKETWRKPALVGNLRGEGLKSGLRDLDVRLINDTYEVIVACDDGGIELYGSLNLNPVTVQLKTRLSVSTQTVNSVRFRPGLTRRFATGGKDGYLRIFDYSSKSETTLVCAIRSQSPVWALRWRPSFDGGSREFIASCQSVMDSCIYVWDLDSRLMPAYIINSHRENVTDFFWADRNHIISCSRDNTVQMHAIKNAIIPLERMRTVNIAIALEPVTGIQTLTSICDVANRDKFERDHEELCIDDIRNFGFPAPAARGMLVVNFPQTSSQPPDAAINEREMQIRRIPLLEGSSLCPERIACMVSPMCIFIKRVASVTLASEVSEACYAFSTSLSGPQSETIRLLGWLYSYNKPVLSRFMQLALLTFQDLNDIVIVLSVGAVAMFASDQQLNKKVSVQQFVRWSKALLEILRRLGKYQLAAEFIFSSPFSEVRSFSHSRTGFSLACGNCKHPQDSPSHTCSKCNTSIAECCLCGEVVKGLWVSFTGCGHGGHLNHMNWWLEKHSLCPVPHCARPLI